MSEEPKLSKEQQHRLDSIVQIHLDYIDEFYDKKDSPPKKKAADYRKPRQDIFLPEKKKKPKKPKYGPGICEHPGCGVTFEKTSGVQRNCPKHRKSPKYVPIAERDKNGSES